MTSVEVYDFDRYYEVYFGEMVCLAYGLHSDLAWAHTTALTTFRRAWRSWHRLHADDPARWARQAVIAAAGPRRWLRRRVPLADLEGSLAVKALQALTPQQRAVVVLHDLARLPITEIAQRLALPEQVAETLRQQGHSVLAVDLRQEARQIKPSQNAEQLRSSG